MIVRLFRPENKPGPWLLWAPSGEKGFIEPTREMLSQMEGLSGYFEAEPTDDGWQIGQRVEDQRW